MYSIRISEQILTKNEKIGWEIFILYAFEVSPLKLVVVGDYNFYGPTLSADYFEMN